MTGRRPQKDMRVRSILATARWLAEGKELGPDAGPGFIGAFGHLLKDGVLARMGVQGLRPVDHDIW